MIDASGAYLRFQWPRAGVHRQCATDVPPAVWDHTLLPATWYVQVNPSLPYIWEEGQTSAYYCRRPVTFPAVESVPICTAWWTEAHVCEQLAEGHYMAVSRLGVEPATSGLQVRHATVTLASHIAEADIRSQLFAENVSLRSDVTKLNHWTDMVHFCRTDQWASSNALQ